MFKLLKNLTKKDYALIIISTLLIVFQVWLDLKLPVTFGVIVAFMIYVRLFTNPLTQIAQGITSMQSTVAASERVFEFLESEEMPIEEAKTHLDASKVKGNIEFKHVKFGYNENKIIIKDFSLDVKSGKKWQ